MERKTEGVEPEGFQTAVWPAVRAILLLLLVLLALCVFVAVEQSSRLAIEGTILFALAVGVAAFSQRQEPHRAIGIVAVGILLCVIFLFFGSTENTEVEEADPIVQKSTVPAGPHSLPLSSDGAAQDIPVVQQRGSQ